MEQPQTETADERHGPGREAAGDPGATGSGRTSGGPERQDEDARRTEAFRGARRFLWRPPFDRDLGGLLSGLADDARGLGLAGERGDRYGDGVVAVLERRVAELLGFPDAAFFPTGTMAQQVALRCWAGRTGSPVVALHPLAHPERHERGALSAVSGLRTVHPCDGPGQLTAQDVRDFQEPFGTLMLELPLRDAGFTLPTWEELQEVVGAARERDAVVHFDGARLWDCAAHFGRDLAEVAQLADSVYVSFYKSLGGLSGAALAGPAELVEEARAWRHRYGGQVFQQYPAAVSALAGLERELPRLPSYAAHARVVARALREGFGAEGVPWFRVHPEVPHTHQFQVWLPYEPDVLTEAALRQAEKDGTVLFTRWAAAGAQGPGGVAFTEVTVGAAGLEWDARQVREAVGGFLEQVRDVAAG
ncbi:beta-eliminating lyase-related protein [Streptomyces sp. NPDC001941]|uniref:threonine aldolase family protein n=1 Tax=Streptomyces sp. NPDC001941 TaxID=3154659 RepID=UPI00331ABBFC